MACVAALLFCGIGCRPARNGTIGSTARVQAGAIDGGAAVATAVIAPGAAAIETATGPVRVEVAPGVAPAPATMALPPRVRLSIRSSPRATVQWGRKKLGNTPLTLERPRESGPMDLVLRAPGYVNLHTRAYTFRNDSLSVEMVRLDKKDALLGAKKAPPPLPPASASIPSPDGGVAPAVAVDGGPR